ncbi:MAG: hypothetical protein U5K31_05020 [Balneolaceae bacterium]|nr:hypothetical protein [Balneolaceae bacterium]
MDIDELAGRLAPHYSHFDVADRLLFTGHSHQAWPDAAREGLLEAWEAAAGEVDAKWERAFEKVDVLRGYLRDWYDDPDGLWCRGENTHTLLVSWLSALDLPSNPRVVTTDAEFHSMARQLKRLEEEGVTVDRAKADPDSLVRQLGKLLERPAAALMLSRVWFESAVVNRRLPEIAALARERGVPLLVDDYHGTNVVPLSLREAGMEDCYLLVGGYKYLQWGEGNCFLRYPTGCGLRPVVTGWFADFGSLDRPQEGPVAYGEEHMRFASGTFDPAPVFRAAAVVEFFRAQGLTPQVLRRQYRAQVGLLRECFRETGLNPDSIRLLHERPLDQTGGFLALQAPRAREIRAELMRRGVWTDARGEVLRMGPAPYTTSDQIREAVGLLAEAVRSL